MKRTKKALLTTIASFALLLESATSALAAQETYVIPVSGANAAPVSSVNATTAPTPANTNIQPAPVNEYDPVAILNQTKALQIEEVTVVIDYNVSADILLNAMRSPLSSYTDANICGISRTYYHGSNTLNAKLKYNDNRSEKAVVDAVIKDTAPSLVGPDAYTTILNVHDYICNTADYDFDTYNGNGEAYGAYDCLWLHSSVCSGYALAFQAYMEYLGIPCYYASGRVNGGNHAWNIVQLDGQWYHIDCTWDGQDEETYHRYFLLGADRCGYGSWGGVALAEYSYQR